MFRTMAQLGGDSDTHIFVATYLKAHRRAANPWERGRPCAIGRAKVGLNLILGMVNDERGWPRIFVVSLCRMSDARGASVLSAESPPARPLLVQRGYRPIVLQGFEDDVGGGLDS